MWVGSGSILGGYASSEADSYATQPASMPTYASAPAIWTPDDAAFYLNQNKQGTEWPTLPNPNIASVQVNLHLSRMGQNGNLRMLPVSRSPNDCDGFEKINQVVSGIVQDKRPCGLYSAVLMLGVVHNLTNSITLGTGDLTAEGFINLANINFTSGGIWDFRASTSDTTRPEIHMVTTNKLALLAGGADILIASSAMPADNNFHHWAWCRASGTSYLYVDGASVGSVADANNYAAATTIHIGNNVAETQQGCNWFSEHRLTVGVALYPGGTSFTVPAIPFPDS